MYCLLYALLIFNKYGQISSKIWIPNVFKLNSIFKTKSSNIWTRFTFVHLPIVVYWSVVCCVKPNELESIVGERVSALRKLKNNPHDKDALGTIFKVQQQVCIITHLRYTGCREINSFGWYNDITIQVENSYIRTKTLIPYLIHWAMNWVEGSYQLSHAYDRFLDATADRRIKTRTNWVPASAD